MLEVKLPRRRMPVRRRRRGGAVFRSEFVVGRREGGMPVRNRSLPRRLCRGDSIPSLSTPLSLFFVFLCAGFGGSPAGRLPRGASRRTHFREGACPGGLRFGRRAGLDTHRGAVRDSAWDLHPRETFASPKMIKKNHEISTDPPHILFSCVSLGSSRGRGVLLFGPNVFRPVGLL